MNKDYDLIIIGCGGIGSAALYKARLAGLSVLCIEQYEKGHHKGGTHGETRMFRKAYYDNPAYKALLEKAYLDWNSLAAKSKKDLFIENGVLEMVSADSEIVEDALRYAEEFQLAMELLSDKEIIKHFPGFQVAENTVGIFQPQGGFLLIDNCMNFFINTALDKGAELVCQEKVLSWNVDAHQQVEIQTDKTTYKSNYLIISTGSWTPGLLPTLNIPITILQKKLLWASVPPNAYSIEKGSPCFAYHLNKDLFYGFPSINGLIKVARHNGGQLLNAPNENPSDFKVQEEEVKSIKEFIRNYLPQASSISQKEANCLYDSTPDGNFIIANHPNYPQIAFAAGLSGHAYKMSTIVAQILIDLVTKQSTDFDISFLSLKRFIL